MTLPGETMDKDIEINSLLKGIRGRRCRAAGGDHGHDHGVLERDGAGSLSRIVRLGVQLLQ